MEPLKAMPSLKDLKKQTTEAWHVNAQQRRADTLTAVAHFNLTRSRDHAEEQQIEHCVAVTYLLPYPLCISAETVTAALFMPSGSKERSVQEMK